MKYLTSNISSLKRKLTVSLVLDLLLAVAIAGLLEWCGNGAQGCRLFS